eukprot:2108507-Prymnesium_polylepis.1
MGRSSRIREVGRGLPMARRGQGSCHIRDRATSKSERWPLLGRKSRGRAPTPCGVFGWSPC